MAVWAGARFQFRPKAAFSRLRCTVMNVSMERYELPPGTAARIENSRTLGQLIELSFRPARLRDLTEQADQLVERSQGNLLVDWLPCIDSEISPRRNLPIGSRRRFIPGVASRTQPLRSVV